MLRLLFLCLAFLIHCCMAQEPQEGCRALEHCLTSVDLLRSECKNATTATNHSLQSESQSCVPGVKKKLAKLDEMQAEQRRQYRDCLLNRMKLSVAINGQEKQAQCQKLVADYRATVASFEDAQKDLDAESDPEELDASKAIRTKRDEENPLAQLCSKKSIEEKLRKCNALATCCSEATFCELEYQLTTLHDDIALQQMATFIEMRRCAQQEGRAGIVKPTRS